MEKSSIGRWFESGSKDIIFFPSLLASGLGTLNMWPRYVFSSISLGFDCTDPEVGDSGWLPGVTK